MPRLGIVIACACNQIFASEGGGDDRTSACVPEWRRAHRADKSPGAACGIDQAFVEACSARACGDPDKHAGGCFSVKLKRLKVRERFALKVVRAPGGDDCLQVGADLTVEAGIVERLQGFVRPRRAAPRTQSLTPPRETDIAKRRLAHALGDASDFIIDRIKRAEAPAYVRRGKAARQPAILVDALSQRIGAIKRRAQAAGCDALLGALPSRPRRPPQMRTDGAAT